MRARPGARRIERPKLAGWAAWRAILLGLTAWGFLALGALADTLPQPQSDTISDFADLLGAQEEVQLAALLRAIRTETGVHVIVVTMDRISNYGGWGKSIETYATALFNAWGIGDPRRNDGVMILVVSGTREMRIELGSGFSRAFDRRAQEVIDTAMLPRFRDRQMAEGIRAGVRATRERIVEPYVRGEWVGAWRTMLIALGVVGGAAALIYGARAAWSAYVRCPQCGQPGLSRRSETLAHPTSYSAGRGVTYLDCALCGFHEERGYTIAARSDDDDRGSSGGWGGSSGSGFGGGRSSGGGASGKW